jgi:ribosome-binding factor A
MTSRKPHSHKAALGAGSSQRQLRVGEEMRHALAEIFRRGALRDPALRDVNLTVTEVRMAPDLKHATAFVTPLGGGDAAAALEGLRRGTGFLRSALARAVRLRVAPSLDFELDDSFDRVGRIEALLRRPEVARDLEKDAPDDGA